MGEPKNSRGKANLENILPPVGYGAVGPTEHVPEPIPFSKPFITGNELKYVSRVVQSGAIGADGHFTKACAQLLKERFSITQVLMVPSGTAALEMAAILCGIKQGDEVIVPSFTFTSTVNSIMRTGAKPVFADIRSDTLNLDESLVEAQITTRTKAIFPVHYAGVSCEMDQLMAIAQRHNLLVVEDAAQAVNSWYKGKACGSIGDLAAYSFHSTKDYTCGEGGAICLRSPEMIKRAELIRDKGTDRANFLRGEVDQYTWVDVGSSYLPSELACAFLFAQLEMMDEIKSKRKAAFHRYEAALSPYEQRGLLRLPTVPLDCETNCHMFYILLPDRKTRDLLLTHFKQNGISAYFHYVPLHLSPMGRSLGYSQGDFPVTEELSGRLLRLPLFAELTEKEQIRITNSLDQFFTESHGTRNIHPPKLESAMIG